MPTTVILVTSDVADIVKRDTTDGRRLELKELSNYFQGAASGAKDVSALSVETTAVAASGTVTIASGNGTETAVINGTSVAITWATSDTNSAALLAAAINANTTVNKIVSATSALGVVTITCLVPGYVGNAITTTASGTGCTAAQAKLTGGTNDAAVTYPLY